MAVHHQERIIFYDGICNLCQSSVQFILKRDKKSLFSFAALQGKTAQELLSRDGLDSYQLNSFILIENGKRYTRSAAALRVVKHLCGLWPLLFVLIVIPSFIRNAIYDFIAFNRYRWFGKQQSCWLPGNNCKNRFLP